MISGENSAPSGRAVAGALAATLALATANQVALFDWVALARDAWAKTCHYTFEGFRAGDFLRAWGVHAGQAAAAGAALLGTLGWGDVLGRLLRAEPGFTVRMALGFGASALAALGLGLAGLFSPVPAGAFVLAGLALAVPSLGGARNEVRGLFARADFSSRSTRALVACAGAVMLASFVVALGPEGGWDPVYYHLRLPKLYAMAHKIHFVPWIYPSHYPQSIEMLYGLAWLGGGEGAAKLVNFAFLPLCGLALYGLALPWGGRNAVRAAALALSIPLVGTLAGENYIDLGLTFLLLAALSSALKGRVWAAGALLGFAMASKYTGILMAAALLASLPFLDWKRGSVLRAAAAAALPVLPWLAKNWGYTGDPVAPFFYSAFGKVAWAGGISQSTMGGVIPNLYPKSALDKLASLLTSLWAFLKHSSFAVFTPFVLGSLPVLALKARAPNEAFLKSFVLVFTGLTLALAPDGRYWQPAVFPFCVLAALGWERVAEAGRAARLALSGFAVFSALFGAVYHLVDMHNKFTPLFVALGFEERRDYEERTRVPWPWYAPTVRWTNGTVPRGERVAVVSDVQAYLFDHDAIFDCDAPGSVRWITALSRRARTPEDIARQFRQWNCRTVFCIRTKAMLGGGAEEWGREEAVRWARFWNARATVLRRSGYIVVYGLSRKPGKPRAMEDLPGPGDWAVAKLLALKGPGERRAFMGRMAGMGIESAWLEATFGEICLNDGLAAEAAAALKRAAALSPEMPSAWKSLSLALLRAGRMKEARAALDRWIGLEPGSEDRQTVEKEFARKVARQ